MKGEEETGEWIVLNSWNPCERHVLRAKVKEESSITVLRFYARLGCQSKPEVQSLAPNMNSLKSRPLQGLPSKDISFKLVA
jgi:hypothetical protein